MKGRNDMKKHTYISGTVSPFGSFSSPGPKRQHHMSAPIGNTCYIHPPAVILSPVWWTTYSHVLPWSETECGPAVSKAVDWPHLAPTSDTVPKGTETNVSRNIVKQIMQSVHSSREGFPAMAVPGL